jgi:hypothetical protein
MHLASYLAGNCYGSGSLGGDTGTRFGSRLYPTCAKFVTKHEHTRPEREQHGSGWDLMLDPERGNVSANRDQIST